MVYIRFIRYIRDHRQIPFYLRAAFEHPCRAIAGIEITGGEDGIIIAAQLCVGDCIRRGKYVIAVAVLDGDLVSVARVIKAETVCIPGLDNVRHRFLQDVSRQRHIMVAGYVNQLDPAFDDVVELVEDGLIGGNRVFVKLCCIRVGGIIDRQKPIVQKITVNYQLPHICSALQTAQKLNKKRTVFERFCIAVINAKVDIAQDDDLISCVACLPQSRWTGLGRASGNGQRQRKHHTGCQQEGEYSFSHVHFLQSLH